MKPLQIASIGLLLLALGCESGTNTSPSAGASANQVTFAVEGMH